jgi:uncharacterized protein (DUF58 family)
MIARKNPVAEAGRLSSLLPPLLIDAERVAASVWQGVHGRRRGGQGESFWQFRRYDAGDPAERIDWRQSARSDKVYVRIREWEAAQSACLWADMSGSMRYASRKHIPEKAEQARLLLLSLALLLMRGGEKVLWSDGGEFSPVHGKAGLERIALDQADAYMTLPLPPKLRHASMIFASDFLMPQEILQARMQGYAAQNLRGVLLHIIDPLEENFVLEGRVELLGAEGEATLLLPHAGSMHAAYQRRFAEHQARLQHMAKSAGWFYLRHVTDQPPSQVLLRLYQYLEG